MLQNETGKMDQLCPENPCIKSDNFCITEELGDGICQDYNNGPFCNYDMGDCCLVGRNVDHCCTCHCKQTGEDWASFQIYLLEQGSYDIPFCY